MHTHRSYYDIRGNGEFHTKEFKSTFFRFERRVEDQHWSPYMIERVTTWSIKLGWWSIAVQRRTKHFKDRNWIAE